LKIFWTIVLNNFIQDIKLSGDFIFANNQNIEQLTTALKGKNIDEAVQFVSQVELSKNLKEGIIQLLNQTKTAV